MQGSTSPTVSLVVSIHHSGLPKKEKRIVTVTPSLDLGQLAEDINHSLGEVPAYSYVKVKGTADDPNDPEKFTPTYCSGLVFRMHPLESPPMEAA